MRETPDRSRAVAGFRCGIAPGAFGVDVEPDRLEAA
jgi:hypothetical protein